MLIIKVLYSDYIYRTYLTSWNSCAPTRGTPFKSGMLHVLSNDVSKQRSLVNHLTTMINS